MHGKRERKLISEQRYQGDSMEHRKAKVTLLPAPRRFQLADLSYDPLAFFLPTLIPPHPTKHLSFYTFLFLDS